MAYDDPGSHFYPSNGTEGEYFQDRYCYQCAKDAHPDKYGDLKGDPCPILARALGGTRVWQWVYDTERQPSCLVFVPRQRRAKSPPEAPRCAATMDLFGTR